MSLCEFYIFLEHGREWMIYIAVFKMHEKHNTLIRLNSTIQHVIKKEIAGLVFLLCPKYFADFGDLHDGEFIYCDVKTTVACAMDLAAYLQGML